MKFVKYTTHLNENKANILIKEKQYEYPLKSMNSADKMAAFMNELFQLDKKAEEYLYMVASDTKMHPIGVFEISHGTVNASLVSPREIFIRALLCGACNIVLVHNHPSGNTAPSSEDILITKRIKEAGELIGVNLLDHIIVGDDFYSFMRNNIL